MKYNFVQLIKCRECGSTKVAKMVNEAGQPLVCLYCGHRENVQIELETVASEVVYVRKSDLEHTF